MKLPLAALPAALFMFAGLAPQASAISIRDDVAVAMYNALATMPQFQAAGYLGTPGAASSFCSGTLISPTIFLTAAHCVDGLMAANLVVGFDVNFPAGGLGANNVAAIDLDPGWVADPNKTAQFDLAKVILTAPMAGITPAQLYNGNPLGLTGTTIGYGAQLDGAGGALVGANSRLGAQNVIDVVFPPGCPGVSAGFLGVCTDFDRPNSTPMNNTSTFGAILPLPLEGSTAMGDSGGPLFVTLDGRVVDVGVTSRGTNPFGAASQYGDVSVWAPLSDPTNMKFLTDEGIPFVPEPGTGLLLTTCLIAGLGYKSRERKGRKTDGTE